MLIPPGAVIFCYCCCGLLRPRQMLRNQGLLKCRCRMLFNDLKVFLLRRPPAPPPPSPPPPLPMFGGAEAAAGGPAGAAPPGGRGPGWRAAAGGGGGAGSPGAEEWGSPGGEPPASLPSSTSSDDFGKGKAEDRYSLGSSVDSGIRTPLCRICFQGPEQVSPRRAAGEWRRDAARGWLSSRQRRSGAAAGACCARGSVSPVPGTGLHPHPAGLCPLPGPWARLPWHGRDTVRLLPGAEHV